MRTSAYIQVTGTFNQAGIGLQPNDTGGELDPHGADGVGTLVLYIPTCVTTKTLLTVGQSHWRHGLFKQLAFF